MSDTSPQLPGLAVGLRVEIATLGVAGTITGGPDHDPAAGEVMTDARPGPVWRVRKDGAAHSIGVVESALRPLTTRRPQLRVIEGGAA